MKIFTATPAQFQSGEMARLAVHSLRPPRKPGKKRPPRKWLPYQVGTFTPAQFQRGDPWIGHHRREGHLQEPLPELKPLPEAIAQALLDDGPQHTQRLLQ